MMVKLVLPVIFLTFQILEACDSPKEWWETSAFYQIYPRSFKDSDEDGVGDLNGITEKLTHLKDIGINAFWLSPIFESPMADFGYDISNFRAIQPEYGTMEDFEALVARAKSLGLKVILDFVPNHSSDEHEWFGKSVRKEPGYEDYYIWHPGKTNPIDPSSPLPPNNWIAGFRGSAWEWNDVRGEFYYHKFAAKQPDLNYRNPAIIQEMKEVLIFWLDKGVDGFRIDAVPTLFEIKPDASGNFLDEPVSGTSNDPQAPDYHKHIYTEDLPEVLDILYEWRKVLDDYQKEHGGEARVIMAETYSAINIVMQYYGNSSMNGAHIPFNFRMITGLNSQSTASDFKSITDVWLNNMPKGRTANWVIGNHDQRRVASRLGESRTDAMNMILLTLPGASVTYNGEEIGMIDVDISFEDSVDPAACNAGPDLYKLSSRDPERTPFQWDTTSNAGFTTGTSTWLPISPNYAAVNVMVQSAAPKSYLKNYKYLTTLRQSRTLQYGSTKTSVVGNVFAITREIEGSDTMITIANLGSTSQTVNVANLGNSPVSGTVTVEVASIFSQKSKGAIIPVAQVALEPNEAVVLKGRRTYSDFVYSYREE